MDGIQTFAHGDTMAWPAGGPRSRRRFPWLVASPAALNHPVAEPGFGAGTSCERSAWDASRALGAGGRSLLTEGGTGGSVPHRGTSVWGVAHPQPMRRLPASWPGRQVRVWGAVRHAGRRLHTHPAKALRGPCRSPHPGASPVAGEV